jgi:hypothetical protein
MTKIRPSPGRQTSISVDQQQPTTTRNQQLSRGVLVRTPAQAQPVADLRHLIISTCYRRETAPNVRPQCVLWRAPELVTRGIPPQPALSGIGSW